MSVKVMARVWAHSQRKDGELLVMLALADFSNDAGESWPSIPVLAQKARLTERQTRRILNTLELASEIRRNRSDGGRNRRNHYFITLSENPDNITGKELQGKNNSVTGDTKTLPPMSGALNRHRTVNKNTEPNDSTVLPHSKKRKQSAPDPATLADFDHFYEAYPRHIGREDALNAWFKLNPTAEVIKEIMAGVGRYKAEVQNTEPRFIKHPAAWLNSKRWTDEPSRNGNGYANSTQVKELSNGMFEVDRRHMDQRTYERRYGERTN